MKKIIALLGLLLGVQCFAVDAVSTFRNGIQSIQKNGPETLLSNWYLPEETARIQELRTKFNGLSAALGPVIDTEVFQYKQVGSRLTHLYGVVYFRKRPVWIRADYYWGDGSGGYVHLDFSLKPDDILPFDLGGVLR